MKVEFVSRVVRLRGLAQAFVSLPRLRETCPCCPNSASICLWSGLGPELQTAPKEVKDGQIIEKICIQFDDEIRKISECDLVYPVFLYVLQ